MVGPDGFVYFCFVLVVVMSNPPCLYLVLECVKGRELRKKKVGASITREMSDCGNQDFVESQNLKA